MRPVRQPFTLTPETRQAIKSFRDAKPWRGDLAERAEKFSTLHRGLCRAYDLETILVRDDAADPDHTGTSGGSYFDPRKNRIVLRGRLSAVTYLFLFGRAVGMTRAKAIVWVREQFAHYFPRSFRGCREEGGLLVRA
jgi:hypothetical protein